MRATPTTRRPDPTSSGQHINSAAETIANGNNHRRNPVMQTRDGSIARGRLDGERPQLVESQNGDGRPLSTCVQALSLVLAKLSAIAIALRCGVDCGGEPKASRPVRGHLYRRGSEARREVRAGYAPREPNLPLSAASRLPIHSRPYVGDMRARSARGRGRRRRPQSSGEKEVHGRSSSRTSKTWVIRAL